MTNSEHVLFNKAWENCNGHLPAHVLIIQTTYNMSFGLNDGRFTKSSTTKIQLN